MLLRLQLVCFFWSSTSCSVLQEWLLLLICWHIRHSLGNLTKFNIPIVGLEQRWQPRLGWFLWCNSSSYYAVHLHPLISRRCGSLKTTWSMFKMEWVELLYILRVFGHEPAQNELDWKLSSLGKTVGNFAKYKIQISISSTGGRIIYEYNNI